MFGGVRRVRSRSQRRNRSVNKNRRSRSSRSSRRTRRTRSQTRSVRRSSSRNRRRTRRRQSRGGMKPGKTLTELDNEQICNDTTTCSNKILCTSIKLDASGNPGSNNCVTKIEAKRRKGVAIRRKREAINQIESCRGPAENNSQGTGRHFCKNTEWCKLEYDNTSVNQPYCVLNDTATTEIARIKTEIDSYTRSGVLEV